MRLQKINAESMALVNLVSFAAVFWDVTQRSPKDDKLIPLEGALRDPPKPLRSRL